MKILYAIQGTGNGHLSRAREIVPHLEKHGKVDLLVSGTQAEVHLEQAVKYQLHGLGFVFGTKGGIDWKNTWRILRTKAFLKDCWSLPVQNYDLIINDFEPVTAWACRLKGKKSVALSHQASLLSNKTPKIKGFHLGKAIIKHYAPANRAIGFHFKPYDDFIHPPIIRSEIRSLIPEIHQHYTVYLPAYSDHFLVHLFNRFPNERWQIFSKRAEYSYSKDNTTVFPVDQVQFQTSFKNCKGFLTGGGFESPAEALFLKKKLLAVPMKDQYEQQCNALALQELGVPVVWKDAEFFPKIQHWISEEQLINLDFPDETEQIVEQLIRNAHEV